MAITTTLSGPYFASGAISFSNLRRNLRAQNPDETFNTDNNKISMSDLLRNVSVAATDPIIPDVTDNVGIGTTTNVGGVGAALTVGQFRNVVKYVKTTIPAEDTIENFDLATISFNGYTTNNIRKTFIVEGQCVSSNPTLPAFLYSGSTRNLIILVNGNIYGAGGTAGGGNAGAAVSFTNVGDTITIQVGNNGSIFGGGGGGGNGGAGGNGGQGGISRRASGRSGVTCNSCTTVETGIGVSGTGGAAGAGPAGRGWGNLSGSLTGGVGINGSAGTQSSNSTCVGAFFSGRGGTGGKGGNGGSAGDWGENGNSGSNGSAGTLGENGIGGSDVCGPCCPPAEGGCGVACPPATGDAGTSGFSGQAGTSGGLGGAAIQGSGYVLTGNTGSDRVKGSVS